MSKTLLVDDIRDIQADIICRNYDAAIEVASSLWLYDWTLLLDHDLGECKSGYDFVNYLINQNNIPNRIFVVSSNPVGRDNIGRAIESLGTHRRMSPHEFIRTLPDAKAD